MSKLTENSQPVAITGLGAVSKAGIGALPLWEATLLGASLASEGLLSLSEGQRHSLVTDLKQRGFDGAESLSLFEALTLHSIVQAMTAAGWDQLTSDDGLVLGTTTGNILLWEGDVIRSGETGNTDGVFANYQSLAEAFKALRGLLKFSGPSLLVATACSSSTQAMGLGASWIREGKVKRCLVGGAEVLSRLTVEGFRCLQLLSPVPSTPFDQNRKGINLSEGSAFFCLEPKRSSRAVAYLSGFGMSSDAYHLTAPHPEGQGCFESMKGALESAGISPSEVTAIHAHGTGSTANDLTEGLAVQRLFGTENAPWVFSTKGVHGHALGASGALESVLSVSALQKGLVLCTAGLTQADSRLSLRHATQTFSTPVTHVLKNSLGFGGANASLLLSHPNSLSEEGT